MNRVLAGELSGKSVVYMGKVVKVGDREINKDTVNSWEEVNKTSITTTKKNGIGRAVVGDVLFGDVGAVIGASTAKSKSTTESNHTIAIHWADGKESLVGMDDKAFQSFLRATYAEPYVPVDKKVLKKARRKVFKSKDLWIHIPLIFLSFGIWLIPYLLIKWIQMLRVKI